MGYNAQDDTGGQHQGPVPMTGYGFYTVRVGWECPRCGRINSPTLPQCLCKPSTAPYMTRYEADNDFVQHSPLGDDFRIDIDATGVLHPHFWEPDWPSPKRDEDEG